MNGRLDSVSSWVVVAAAVAFGFILATFLQSLAGVILSLVDADHSGFSFRIGERRVDYGALLAAGIALAFAGALLGVALRRRA